MWYDRSRARVIFFAGVMLMMIGYGIYLMGHKMPGAVIMVTGLPAMMIGFTIIVMHLFVDFKKKW